MPSQFARQKVWGIPLWIWPIILVALSVGTSVVMELLTPGGPF